MSLRLHLRVVRHAHWQSSHSAAIHRGAEVFRFKNFWRIHQLAVRLRRVDCTWSVCCGSALVLHRRWVEDAARLVLLLLLRVLLLLLQRNSCIQMKVS